VSADGREKRDRTPSPSCSTAGAYNICWPRATTCPPSWCFSEVDVTVSCCRWTSSATADRGPHVHLRLQLLDMSRQHLRDSSGPLQPADAAAAETRLGQGGSAPSAHMHVGFSSYGRGGPGRAGAAGAAGSEAGDFSSSDVTATMRRQQQLGSGSGAMLLLRWRWTTGRVRFDAVQDRHTTFRLSILRSSRCWTPRCWQGAVGQPSLGS
jgi:hypothetical protein